MTTASRVTAYGFGGTQRDECEIVSAFEPLNYNADCNELGEACDLLGGESDPGLCIQIIWADDTVDPPVLKIPVHKSKTVTARLCRC